MIEVKLGAYIDPNRSLEGFIQQLISIKNEYSEQGYSNLNLCGDYYYEDYGDSRRYSIKLWGSILETDDQYEKRMKEEENRKNKQLERERKEV